MVPSSWYYLNPENGAMYADTQITVDGVTYNVDSNGACHEVVLENTNELETGTSGGSIAENNSGMDSDVTDDGIIANIVPFGS